MLVDKIRGQLSDADRKLLDEWLADRSISTQRITDALCDEGYQLSKAAVDHWRARVPR